MTGTTDQAPYGHSKNAFRALLLVQGLSVFAHNQLRFWLLTFVAFGNVSFLGLSGETVIGLSTIVMVFPLLFASVPAGRMADRWDKSSIIRRVKFGQLLLFAVSAQALWWDNFLLLLVCLALCGLENALFGPARYSILPELVQPAALVSANASMKATLITSILGGMIMGSLLGQTEAGKTWVALLGIAAAAVAWTASHALPELQARAPSISLSIFEILLDFRRGMRTVLSVPGAKAPIFGANWFWFQGAITTTLLPVYVQQSMGLPPSSVAVLLTVTSLGAVAGAALVKAVDWQNAKEKAPFLTLLVISGPSLWIWYLGTGVRSESFPLVLSALFVISAGTGFFVVPVTTLVQLLSPEAERSRLIGVSQTLSGIALVASGLVITSLAAIGLRAVDILTLNAMTTAIVAAFTLRKSVTWLNVHLDALQSTINIRRL